MRRIEKINFTHGNWAFWIKYRNPLKVAFNLIICGFAMICPFLRIKNSLLSLTGMKVGKNAFIAMGTVFDIFYPELIEIGENVIIGYGCVVTAHEMMQNELRIGKIKIGANSVVGMRSVILPGIEIGENSIIGAMSMVNCDVPVGKFYAGIPAREIRG